MSDGFARSLSSPLSLPISQTSYMVLLKTHTCSIQRALIHLQRHCSNKLAHYTFSRREINPLLPIAIRLINYMDCRPAGAVEPGGDLGSHPG